MLSTYSIGSRTSGGGWYCLPCSCFSVQDHVCAPKLAMVPSAEVLQLMLIPVSHLWLSQSLSPPAVDAQAQQLDQVLVNLTEALAALKKQEAQGAANKAETGDCHTL